MSRDGTRFTGVRRVYRSAAGSVEALHAADGAFAPGAIGALVGPSGSGKSTLLRVLGGIDAADAGTVTVDGIDVRRLRGAALRRFRRESVGFLAQRAAANLVPQLTLREQLGPNGLEQAGRVGLSHRIDAIASALSGGEQARAALAVGLSRGTPVILLDEPTAELDRHAAALVIAELRTAAADGRTVIVATHDAELVALADARLELTLPTIAVPHAQHVRRTSDEPIIVLEHVTKSYAGAAVVGDASLDVRAGELAVLLGRSGSGKSTLLMAAGGWLSPDHGTVRTPGPRWHETAHLAQRFGLIPELSVAENVGLPLRLRGSTDDAFVAHVLEQLGLAELHARLPEETSIGQQQRTALARALADRPSALLADEPTSHQDTASAALVWHALDAACAEGTACLVATHDEAASRHADRVWRIEDGHIVD
ncbi:MAG TPA: ATP-binding cassette domain-containing protein [Gaiellaceae bacterium]